MNRTVALNRLWDCLCQNSWTGHLVRNKQIMLQRAGWGISQDFAYLIFYADGYEVTLIRKLRDEGCVRLLRCVGWKPYKIPTISSNQGAIQIKIPWQEQFTPPPVARRDLTGVPVSGDGKYRFRLGYRVGTDSQVTANFSDVTSNWLVGGQPGYGKSTLIKSIIMDLGQIENVMILGLCPKGKTGLGIIERLPGVVGPIGLPTVTNPEAMYEEAKARLGWAVRHMYTALDEGPTSPLFVFCDEVHILARDKDIVAMLVDLMSMGRQADVHCVLATQQMKTDALRSKLLAGSATGRISFKVAKWADSYAILGRKKPDASKLKKQGECFVVASEDVGHVQTVDVTEQDIAAAGFGSWPIVPPITFDRKSVPTFAGEVDKAKTKDRWSDSEKAAAIQNAMAGGGYPTLANSLGLNRDNHRIRDLNKWAKSIVNEMASIEVGG